MLVSIVGFAVINRPPGDFMDAVVLLFNFVGGGLRDAADPYKR